MGRRTLEKGIAVPSGAAPQSPAAPWLKHSSALPQRARETAQRLRQYIGLAVNALGWTRDQPLTGPLYADISISDPCNHRCVMCHFHPPGKETPLAQFGGRQPAVMDMATFRRTIDDLYRLGTREVTLVGRGEPLLNPQACDMAAYAKKKGFRVKLNSNGSRLTAERAQALTDAGLDLFQCSVNAARPETYPKIHVTETPDDFLALKANLKELVAARARVGTGSPQITLSFAIGALNYAELTEMVETIAEIGADAGHFQHWLPVTDSAVATALSDAQYDELMTRLIPAATKRAAQLGLRTNLKALADAPPTYRLDQEDTGPSVVPCYIGSYFTAILSNGSVMPCCQTREAVGSITDRGFEAVWRSEAYAAFRHGGRHLPEPSAALATSQCDRCYFRPQNIAVHNIIHPLKRIRRREQRLSLKQLVRMTRMDK